MAPANRNFSVDASLRRRSALLRSTALQAAFVAAFAMPAMAAGLAPNAQPTGGQVVAGAASISQSPANTLIQQSSQRAAIDWKSYNVGSQQSVTYQQPNATATTLNRITGPDPSVIAGKITANGQIIISNQSGVIFSKGSVVDTAGLVATSANITNQNFMSGKMVFDQAGKPNAQIVNEGTLTARQAGLVGLVAPSVANSGVINARMGHVVLAGAETHTVDMYGDGLLSIDVTGQVRQAPIGPNGKPVDALVTNTGVIAASGGTVLLTAAAADGIVQNLVDARGKVSVGAGRISIAGTGGSVQIDGKLLANAHAAGATGGQIAVNATDTVIVGPNAKLSANGPAGGGTIAVGTTLARAAGGNTVPSAATARRVGVQQGATITANATRNGPGGRVVLLSTDITNTAGSIAAKGGPQGGDGGFVEISGATLALAGRVDVGAPLGKIGTILLDPTDIVIDNGSTTVTLNPGDPLVAFDPSTANNPGTITPTSIAQFGGDIHIEATHNITVNTAITPAVIPLISTLTLEAGNNIQVNANIAAPNTIRLIAASPNSPTPSPGGAINIASGVTITNPIPTTETFIAAPQILMSAGTGGITIGGIVGGAQTTLVSLTSAGAITQPGGFIQASILTGRSGGNTALTQSNTITTLGTFAAAGSFAISDTIPVGITDTISAAGKLTINDDAISFTSGTFVPGGFASVPGGTIVLDPLTPGASFSIGASTTLGASVPITADTLVVGSPQAGPVTVAGSFTLTGAPTLSLQSGASVAQGTTGTLTANTVAGSAGGSFSLGSPTQPDQITALGAISAVNSVSIANATPLTVKGLVSAPGQVIQIFADQLAFAPGGTLDAGFTATATAASITGLSTNLVFLSPLSSGDALQVSGGNGTGGAAVTRANAVVIGSYQAGSTFVQPSSVGISGALNFGAAAVLLRSSGAIAETGAGAIATPLLIGNANSFTLAGSNAIAELGPITAFAPSVFNDVQPLTISGPVTVNNGDAPDALAVTSTGAITLAGNVAAGAVTLSAGGAITQTAGSLSATTLTGNAAGVSLPGANAVVNLGSFTSAGSFVLFDTQPVTITGPVTVTGVTPFLEIADNTFPTIGTNGALVAASGTVQLAPYTTGNPTTVTALPGGITATTLAIGATDGGAISIAAPVNVASVPTLELLSAGAITETPAGKIAAQALTGQATTVSLNQANAIATLGSFTATGAFLLDNASALSVTGPVNAGGTLSLATTSGDIGLAGNLTAPAISLMTAGNIVQTAGAVSTNLLTGSANSATLNDTGNTVANLGSFTTASTFSLTDASSLTVSGAVDPTSVTLNTAGSLTIANFVSADTVDLIAAGAINETSAGGIFGNPLSSTGAFLTGNAGGTVSMTAGFNFVDTLGPFASRGGLVLRNDQALRIAGPVTDTASATISSLGPMSVTGSIGAPAISLTANNQLVSSVGERTVNAPAGTIFAAGDFTQSAGSIAGTTSVSIVADGTIAQTGGNIATPLLTGRAGGPASFSSASNTVANLGSFTSTGGFALTDNAPLTVSGPLSETSTIRLATSGALTLAGNIAAPGSVLLTSQGNVTQPGGVISTGTLGVMATGGISITQGNSIASLGVVSGAGTVSIADSLPLTIPSTLTATGTNPLIVIADDTPNITATGTVIAAGGTVQLAPFTTGGTSTLLGVSPNITANTLAIGALTGGGVVVAGPVNAGGIPTLELLSAGAISETAAGSIASQALTGQAASVSLNRPNTVASLGSFTTTGTFLLDNAAAVAVTGPVNAGGSLTLATTTGDIGLAGNLSAPSITLTSAGNINQTTGAISTNQLTGSADSATLNDAGNTIANLGPFATNSSFSLTDASSLAVTGAIDPASVTLNTAGNLTIANIVSADTVNLIATGAITETSTGGIVGSPGSGTGAFLTGNAGGAVSLATGQNLVDTLGAFSSNGGLNIRDNQTLKLAGPLNDSTSITLRTLGPLVTSGPIASGTINLIANTNAQGGTIVAAGNFSQVAGFITAKTALNITADGSISQTGGGIVTPLITGSAGTTVSLICPTNLIDRLGVFASSGGFELVDGKALTVTGPVTDATGTINIDVAGAIALAGTMSAPGSVLLAAQGNITQPSGVISTGTLGISSTGSIAITQANSIATLGGVAGVGTVSISDSQPLAITGLLSASGTNPLIVIADDTPTITATGTVVASGGTVQLAPFTTGGTTTLPGFAPNITANTLAIGAVNGGGIVVAGAVNTGGVPTLELLSAGAVTETAAGSITAQSLIGQAASVSLGQPNSIANLGSFTTSGAFVLNDTPALVVAGPLNVGGNLALTTGGNLTLAGNLSAPSANLVSRGAIRQSAGSFTAATLTGSANGAAQFGGGPTANIGTLAGFSVSGTNGALALTGTGPLTLQGTVSAANIAITAPSRITLNNGTIATAGLPVASQNGAAPLLPGSFISVTPAAGGGAAQLVQTGTTTITSANGATPTIRLQVPDDGSIQLANLAAGGANVILGTSNRGTAIGNLSALSLLVLGQGGSATLTGSVANQTGGTAAQVSAISPAINVLYTLNGCVIGSVICNGTTPPPPNPPTPPFRQFVAELFPSQLFPAGILRPDLITLQLLTLGLAPDPSDPDLLLPNISAQDY